MLGIDTSKASLSAAFVDPVSRVVLWEKTVSHCRNGISTLLEKTPPDIPWVIEPTGRLSLDVVQQANQAGRSVLMAPTRQAKAFAQCFKPRAKTDRIDSVSLAFFGLSRPLPFYPVKSAMAEQIDQLLSARKQLCHSRTSLRLQMQELSHVREALQPVVDKIDEQVAALDRQIQQLSTQDHDIKSAYTRLLQVHGVGPVTAASLATRLTSRDFPTDDQFVAYIGLDIGVRQSGKRQGQTGLSKRGDAELRRLLYLCAQANLRTKDSPFKAQYERERAKGLTSTGALCAVARKIATICWALIRYDRQYDPKRVAQRIDKTNMSGNQELESKEN